MRCTEPRFRSRVAGVLVLLALGAGCASGCATTSIDDEVPPPATPLKRPVAPKPIGHRWEAHVNLVCLDFCERLASCWYAEPRADQTLSKEAVVTACRREESNCRQSVTTDRQCCGWLRDCKDFVACEQNSLGAVSDCKLAAPVVADHPPMFEPARKN